VEGLYGSVNKGGMQKIINVLRDKCGLDGTSRLVDIGAGLGRCAGEGCAANWAPPRATGGNLLPPLFHHTLHAKAGRLDRQLVGPLERSCHCRLFERWHMFPCRPLMHALVEPGIASAFGVEIDRIKCDKAVAFLRQAVLELQRRGVSSGQFEVPVIQCAPIEQVGGRPAGQLASLQACLGVSGALSASF
jgi:hypothetical protein